jgi:hypothetical protein
MVFMQWRLMYLLPAVVFQISLISLAKLAEQEIPPLHEYPYRSLQLAQTP